MKVVLVDNLVMPADGSLTGLDVHPHMGLLSLAAVAEADGHAVRIYDPKRLIRCGKLPFDSTIYERAALDLLAERPEAVGFTALGCSFLFALHVAGRLKRREPDLPVLLGGPHATMLHRQILERFPQFDVVVRHEADETFPAVLDRLGRRAFDDIPGLSWRGSRARGLRFNEGSPKVEDLDRLPMASYDHYPVADLGLDLLRIEAGRGCPFACTFCSTASFFQRSFRLKSAGRLVAELDRLHQRYGHSDFKLDHDLFTVNRRKVLEFCEAVKGRGYRWRASARVDCVDPELLAVMARAGCVGLYFGIESGSERIQRIAQKRLDLRLVEPTLEAAERLGIETTASFITGYPEEGERDQDETLDLLGRCVRPSCLAQLHVLAPEPGTPLFERFGGRLAYDGYAGPYHAPPMDPEDERLVTGHRDLFSTYHHYPAAMPRRRYLFAAQAVDVLRRVGPIVLRYALRAYGGRLSVMLRAFRRWARENGRGLAVDAALVEAFIADAFGHRHHLSSLFRYAIHLEAAGARSGSPLRPPAFDERQRYRLGAHVHVLSDSHDCGLLLDRIRRHPQGTQLLDDAETGERGAYLVIRSGATPVSYRIEPGVEAILSLFEQPRTCREVAAFLCDLAGGAEVEPGFFASLVRCGILVPAAPMPDVTPVAAVADA